MYEVHLNHTPDTVPSGALMVVTNYEVWDGVGAGFAYVLREQGRVETYDMAHEHGRSPFAKRTGQTNVRQVRAWPRGGGDAVSQCFREKIDRLADFNPQGEPSDVSGV